MSTLNAKLRKIFTWLGNAEQGPEIVVPKPHLSLEKETYDYDYIETIFSELSVSDLMMGDEVNESQTSYDLTFSERKTLALAILNELANQQMIIGYRYINHQDFQQSVSVLLRHIAQTYERPSTRATLRDKTDYGIGSNDPRVYIIDRNIEEFQKQLNVTLPGKSLESIIAFEKAKLKQYLAMAEKLL